MLMDLVCRWLCMRLRRVGRAVSAVFLRNGPARLVADARGAVATRRDGDIDSVQGGFRGDDKGTMPGGVGARRAAAAAFSMVRADPGKKASLGVIVDAKAHYDGLFLPQKC